MVSKKISVLVFSIFYFVDPTLFYRVIVGNDILSIAIFLVLFLFNSIICIKIVQAKYNIGTLNKYLFLFLLYALLSSAVRIYVGQDKNYVIQHEVILIQCLFLFILLSNPKYQRILINAYFVAVFLHLLTIIPVFDSLIESVAKNTAYFMGEYNIGIFKRRGTGFFNSSGQLALFSIGGLTLGLHSLSNRSKLFSILFISISVTLGIASLSRSFFIAFLAIFLISTYRSTLKARIGAVLLSMVVIFLVMNNPTFIRYSSFITNRFSAKLIFEKNDRVSGETGITESLKVIENYPLFGYPVLNEGKALEAWNGIRHVKPHTGIIMILCYYGIVLAFPLIILIFIGFKEIYKEFGIMNFIFRTKQILNPFVLGLVGVNIICLVEPLIETPVYFFFLFGTIHYVTQNKYCTHQQSDFDYIDIISRTLVRNQNI